MKSLKQLQESVAHARAGGEHLVGKSFKGGQFIPHKMVDGIKIPLENLNIPRHQMPQIRKEKYEDFFQYLRDHDIDVNDEVVKALHMKPTQGEFNTTKVKAMMQGVTKNNDFAILSHDNYILDGHHRWLANFNKGPDTTMPIKRIGMPIMPLLDKAKGFHGTTYRGIHETSMWKFSEFEINEVTLKLGGKKNTNAEEFMKDWIKHSSPHPFDSRARIYGGHTSVEVSIFGNGIHIHDIRSLSPKSGAGTATLKYLQHLADKHKVPLEGTAYAYAKDKQYITKSKRLKDWYVKHGFKSTRGNESDGYAINYVPNT